MSTHKQRLFFALDISAHDKAVISQWWQQQNITNVRAIAPSNYHITLAFLGLVNEQQRNTFIELVTSYTMQTCFASNYPINIDQLAYFKKPQVVCLTFNAFPSPFIALANFISKQAITMELFQEKRPYLPHISIARKVKEAIPLSQLNHAIIINSFSLYLSESTAEGVKYSIIKQWGFGKSISPLVTN